MPQAVAQAVPSTPRRHKVAHFLPIIPRDPKDEIREEQRRARPGFDSREGGAGLVLFAPVFLFGTANPRPASVLQANSPARQSSAKLL